MSDQPAPDEPAARPWARPVLVGSLVVIMACLLSLGVLWLLTERNDDGDALEHRDQAMLTATDFVVRINTFGPDDLDEQGKMPEYAAQVEELMTSKFATEFEEAQTLPEEMVQQAQVGRTATVNAVAVSTLGEASATVLAAFEMTNSYPSAQDEEERVEDRAIPMRWEISLRRIEGEWLVDGYEVIPDRLEEEPTEQPAPDDGQDGGGQNGNGQNGNGQNGNGQNDGGQNGNGGGER